MAKRTRGGVVSDTPGLVRPEVLAALAGSDLIVHAGDVGGAAAVVSDLLESRAVSDEDDRSGGALAGLVGLAREHPVITSVLVVSTLAGAVVGFVVLPPEWHLLRRVAGGATMGALCGLIVAAPRMVG